MTHQNGHEWRQLNLWCDHWQASEQMAVVHLGPLLVAAEHSGQISRWWFIRKGALWRVRLLPPPGQQAATDALVKQVTQTLTELAAIRRWSTGIYEPETHAFGGPEAMEIAHRLFHVDSRHILTHLGHRRPDHRRELAILLGSHLIREAGQEWYEQGDIWARLALHRATDHPPEPTPATVNTVRQLLTATAYANDNPLTIMPAWPAVFGQTGKDLANLAEQGNLTRGLRAVLTHHLLFTFNRHGIPPRLQHLLARAAAAAVLGTQPAESTGATSDQPATAATTVAPVTSDNTHTPTRPATPDNQEADRLRTALVDRIRSLGTFHTPQVEAAFRTVARHQFLPGVDLPTAYAPDVVVTKRAADGTPISSASGPNLVAIMLEQLQVQPGQRVLEIGTATGINAALLAELTGPAGHVVTMEIDDGLAASARAALTAAGYPHVAVISGDGAHGHPAAGPYDRLIVTAGTFDLPTAWWQQLTVGGRLVVPLRLHSALTRSIGFHYQQPGRMVSTSAQMCGFVPMQGTAAHTDRSLRLADDLWLRLDPDDPCDEAALGQALTYPAHERWTGIRIHDNDPVAHLDLWLATTNTGSIRFTKLSAGPDARQRGLIKPAWRWGGAGMFDGATVAYLTFQPQGDDLNELGVVAHGPDSRKLTNVINDLLHQWDQHRPALPTITAHPTGTPEDQLTPGTRIIRPHTILTVTW